MRFTARALIAAVARALLGAGGAGCTASAGDFEVRDEAEWRKVVPAGARLEKLASGMGFVEGPVWIPDGAGGGFLVFSDIPGDELKRWTPGGPGGAGGGELTTFRKPSGKANGNALDREGRLVTCEHGGRRVAILEKDGTLRTLADRYDGKRLSSPNDVAVRSDGTIWFTDPPYGLADPAREREQLKNYVFRLDPASGDLRPVAEDFDRPNGLCFSPD